MRSKRKPYRLVTSKLRKQAPNIEGVVSVGTKAVVDTLFPLRKGDQTGLTLATRNTTEPFTMKEIEAAAKSLPGGPIQHSE